MVIDTVERNAVLSDVAVAAESVGMSPRTLMEKFWDMGSESAVTDGSTHTTIEAVAKEYRETVIDELHELGIGRRLAVEWALARFCEGYFHP